MTSARALSSEATRMPKPAIKDRSVRCERSMTFTPQLNRQRITRVGPLRITRPMSYACRRPPLFGAGRRGSDRDGTFTSASPSSTISFATMQVQLKRARCRSGRSEEHTSELQSLAYLVCRLLLEKKKRNVDTGVHR